MAQSLSPNLPPDTRREMPRRMLTIRRFRERASADYCADMICGVVHCYDGGGPMHVADFGIGVLGANGIVAG